LHTASETLHVASILRNAHTLSFVPWYQKSQNV